MAAILDLNRKSKAAYIYTIVQPSFPMPTPTPQNLHSRISMSGIAMISMLMALMHGYSR